MSVTASHYLAYLESSSNLWCWTLYDVNGRMLARNVEKYYNRAECLAAIEVIKSSSSTPVKEN
jgi:uncharacterized protein YegP (UPF0339 family)